ncbi:TspO/MBR family protein [Bacillus sp. JCM 19041]|uniref:TspO/MBR family protein n=1 Tax=Bacillus sp. JCM 19041 TaxID=1460637 RepID=UPI0006D16CE0
MKQRTTLGITYLLFFALMIFLNYWSATNVGMVANQDQALIQPAGYAFSIWGLIYVLLFIWIVRIFFLGRYEESAYAQVRYWPAVNFALNGMWIIAFTQEWLLVSVLIIIALLTTLVIMYTRISAIRFSWFDRLPFSIYFGWVSVATIVNIFTWIVQADVTTILGLDELIWTLIMLIVTTLLAAFVSLRYRDWAYPLVFLWSFIAIFMENELTSILVVTASCAVVHLALSIIVLIRKKQA